MVKSALRVPDGERNADDPLQALIGESVAMEQVRAMIEAIGIP